MRRITAIAVLLLGIGVPAQAQAQTANVVDFPVQFNHVAMQGAMASTKYPLLLYRDVTYFPMTWYNCRMLGLETAWSQKSGLSIKQNNALASSVGYYPSDQANTAQVQVTIPNFKVTVNGEQIENQRETYPLISFRDVTYFPLTWRFAHDAFGWDYSYTKDTGLQITSHNPQLIAFPALANRKLQTPIKLLDQGCYYYLEEIDVDSKRQVRVCRAPVDNRFRKQIVYTFQKPPSTVDFMLLDGIPSVIYREEAGGQQHILQVRADGTAQTVQIDLSNYVNGSSYQANDVAKNKMLAEEPVEAVTICEGYLLCKMAADADYGAKIFDHQGKLVLAVTGKVDSISLSDGIVLLSRTTTDGNEYLNIVYLK